MLKITVLAENLVRQRGLLAEHGLSLWIENRTDDDVEHVLFDTGQTDIYQRNAQLLVIRRPQGLVVISGCSHPGVINCLMAVRRHFGSEPIHTVVGGMHLGKQIPNAWA